MQETTNKMIINDIDRTAPVIARQECLINASIARVWQAHIAVAAWPRWQKDITEATINRELEVGTQIRWVTHGINEPIVSTIHRLDSEQLTLWGGPAMGIVGLHLWLFESAPGGTLVRTEESWAGPPVEDNPKAMQIALDGSLQRWLNFLANYLV